MIGRKLSPFSFVVAILSALALTSGIANAITCSNPVTGTVTCTGGAGVSVNIDDNNDADNAPVIPTEAGSPFPSTITVTGGGTAVATVSVTLHGYTSLQSGGADPETSSRDMGLLLISPSGHNLQLMRCVGDPTAAESSVTLTIQDGGAAFPNCLTASGAFASGTYAPSAYPDGSNANTNPNYASVISGFGTLNNPQSNGSHTMNSVSGVFTGDTINGVWKLYLVTDALQVTNISFSSWDITVTYTAASTPSTTTLTPNPTTAYTTSPNNSVTLTATVTSGATGTVTFMDGASNLTCTGSNPATISSNQATCTATFSTEGYHSLSASYSGDGTFVASSGTAAIFIQNHSANTGTTYCNTGVITGDGQSENGFTNVIPYPSVIFIGDGVNTDITSSVDTVSVQLKNVGSVSGSTDLHMLLVAPDGTHALDFWSNAGSSLSGGTYTLMDGSTALPSSGAISAGSYSPTTYGSGFTPNTDLFTPAPGSPAPQLPGTYSVAAPTGSATFLSSFVGAAAHGAWSLFVYNGTATGDFTHINGGWCLDVSPGTGHATSVAVQANPTQSLSGTAVTFTATVSSSPAVGNTGTVTFTENGSPLAGAPNSGVASVSGGVATISTSGLSEGDHTVQALYNDNTNTFNESFGTTTARVDAATSTPTLNGSTWSYCNPTGIVIPAGTVVANDIGPAAPNPSNVFVTNLFGTINTASLTLNGFHITSPGDLESLLVGPNGVSAPTTAQTLDFFSHTGGSGGSTAFGPQTTTFEDSASLVSASSAPGPTDAPTSRGTTSYTASPFYTLPGSFDFAATQGSTTFASAYDNTNPNGAWSVYFDQLIHHSGDGASGWCMNFVENQVAVAATKAHVGSAPNNHFVQGEQGAQFTIDITNNGTGATGDPDGSHPLTVTDTLDASFTYASFTGTGWSCSAVAQVATCLSHSAIQQGANYPTLTILVNVSDTATTGTPVANQASISGGGATSTSSNVNSVTIDPAPVLSVTKSHTGTFTQGQTAVWTITVNNTATSSTTIGTTNLSDTLPAGYTVASFTGSGWSCPASVGTGVLTCTSTQNVTGGSSFNQIQLTVNVPAASPTSVSNTALAWGGGDFTHVSLGTAASGTDSSVPVVQVPASIAINGSSTQQAHIGTAFSSLAVTVKDAASVTIPGYPTVVFTASTGGAGQSGTFDNATNTKTVATGTAGSSGIANPGAFTANNNAGSYTVTVTAGSAPAATFNLANVAPPSIAKSFNPTSISTSSTTQLTFTITNPAANTVSLTGVAFTDTLPTGLTVASASATVCGGSLTTTNPTGIALSGATIAATGQCQFSVTVTGTATGQYTNTTGAITSTNGGTGNTASASLTVGSAPAITKAFGAANIPLNGTTSLTFSLSNPNSGLALTGLAFTDTLPAGLVVAPTPGLSNTCGGTATATAGAGSVSLTAGTLAASANCTVSMSVKATSGGVKNNSVQVTATVGGTGNTSNASVTVAAPPTISKVFGAASLPLNGSTTLSFTVQNNNPTQALSGVGFTDTLPTGLTISTPNGETGSCGGGAITATQATNVITLTGASLAATASCTFSVNVNGTAAGAQINTTGAVTSTEGGTGLTASATVTVVAPPSIAKAFNPAGIAVNGVSTLTFTLTNPAANTSAETGVAFTDNLPANLVIATPSGLANTCGGTATAVAGSGSVSLTGGTIATNTNCSIAVNVTSAQSGIYQNTTGAVSSTNGGTGGTASATLSVASPPVISKAFGAATIALNGSTSLTFTIANPNAFGLTGVQFTDSLPAGLQVAPTPGAVSNCNGTLTASAGATSISLAGGMVAQSGSCAITVNITGTSFGLKNNTTGPIGASQSGPGATSNTASITVMSPPAIAKAFAPNSISLNANSTLTFTIANPTGNPISFTGVAFTDAFPAGLVVANQPNAVNNCGGTFTAVAGATSASLAGSALASGSSCTIAVNVTATGGGNLVNQTGNITSTNGGTGNAASATLSVPAPVTVTTSPAGLSFTVDGVTYTSAQNLAWVPGTSHTISTTSPQPGASGTQFVWTNWSNGGAISQTVVASSSTSSITYTANFATQFLLTTSASPASGGIASPSSGFYNASSSVSVFAQPSKCFAFSGWTGPVVSPTHAFTSITMSAPLAIAANFSAISNCVVSSDENLSLSVNPQAGGTVTATPGPNSGYSYAPGTDVQVQAKPNTGYLFIGFAGDLTANTNPQTLTMDGNKTVVAYFAQIPAAPQGQFAANIQFGFQKGDPPPPPQTIPLGGSLLGLFPITGGAWLQATSPAPATSAQSRATAAATLQFSLNPAVLNTLADGVYTSYVVTGSLTAPAMIQVQLLVDTLAIDKVTDAAGYRPQLLAPAGLFTAFGINLANQTALAKSLPLPNTIGGSRVTVTDSSGATNPALLLYVSPSQINFLTPSTLALGPATIAITNWAGLTSTIPATMADVAPGLFAANSTGSGVAAAEVLTVATDGTRTFAPAADCTTTPGACVALPINLGGTGVQVFLSLFGTGIRGRSSLDQVSVTIGDVPVTPLYAGPQSQFAGLDQIDVQLPSALAGKGAVNVVVTIEGRVANTVGVAIQ